MTIKPRKYQEDAIKAVLSSYKSGTKKVGLAMATGCHAKGHPILMWNGDTRNVEDVIEGDFLMGDDSTPRKVEQLKRGRQAMYEITPVKGESFIVNEDHILSLQSTPTGRRFPSDTTGNEIVNISVSDYLNKSKAWKHKYKLYRREVLEFGNQQNTFNIPPYILGIIIGDGGLLNKSVILHNPDKVIQNEWIKFAKENSCEITFINQGTKGVDRCPALRVKRGKKSRNNLVMELFKNSGLMNKKSGDKFIPFEYKTANYQSRLELLAGLMDTDGSIQDGGYDYISKSEQLARDIVFLSRSVGLAAYIKKCQKSCQNNFTGTYYRVQISGECQKIPCRLKKAPKRKQIKRVTVTGFKIKKLGIRDYYGFSLDGNHLYLDGHFTAHHNSGKTIIFAGLIKEFLKEHGGKALILAHREELLTQAQEKIEWVAPELKTTIEQGQNQANMDADVVIASVPTLGRNGSDRIKKFNPNDYSIIIIDEFHRGAAPSYLNILKYFRVLKNVIDDNRILLLGVTATMFRQDNQSLEDIIDNIVYEYSILQGIKQNYLTNLRAFTVRTNIDISKVKKSGGDFNIKDLGETINKDERNSIILDTYKSYCAERKTIIFCVNVDHAKTVAEILKNDGFEVGCVLGETPSDERKQIIDDFKQNKIRVLVGVSVFVEGFDSPEVDTIIMARPTKSLGLYMQIIGRCTRLFDNKKYSIIYDIVDASGQQGIKTMSSVLGIDELDFQGKDLIEIKDFVDKLKNLSPNINWRSVDVTNPQGEIERLDLIAGLVVPEELSPFTTFNWFKLYAGQYKLNLGSTEDLSYDIYLRENAIGKFEVYLTTFVKSERVTKGIKLESGLPLTEAIRVADSKVNKDFSDKLPLIERSAPWRRQEPTDKQIQLLRKFKVNEATIEQLNKGQASVLMDKLFSEKPKREPKEYTSRQKWGLRKKGILK